MHAGYQLRGGPRFKFPTLSEGLEIRETVQYSVAQSVRGVAHTSGVEEFLKNARASPQGAIHKRSGNTYGDSRYVSEFCGRHNIGLFGTCRQTGPVVAVMAGTQHSCIGTW